ncbi:hypothetical protein AGABI2DRAFT_207516 [Agaricus bisporus var. bisporus H97]|uniref:hypothetical protein n=1 Tax=Agaricus bisporus var. bisporus (strain H97 / ATCC MYA-4626 / FGSC 10389) TaxID=936046 RepID=UPI00029F6278|nr:hypothetical protein AGABI2DRAFT_207516 [Agaricus bisporus var. bisporus H97]EKV46046.1 hypothetical protein AGABI2DRAFT_207516 [Agaricus bisporus var. bisporus H97]
MVDEPQSISEESFNREEEEVPPPPPPRPTRRTSTHPPPVRAAPSAPASMAMEEAVGSHDQWELPAIPTSSLGAELSASWSEAMVDDHQQQEGHPQRLQSHSQSAPLPIPPPAAVTPVPPATAARSLEALHLESDELMAIWGRVGVQICEVATTMYDHSKKTLIGDGTYRGFVNAVLSEVPNASKPNSKQMPFGYLVYVQNGGQVQRRVSEILPGDVMEIVDAKFKGHKGLGTYTQHVGVGVEGGEGGGPVLGVVSEFEHKKSKVRVFQANQHVGQQTVEAVTYRLEDLKSGLVKVYRVLEG